MKRESNYEQHQGTMWYENYQPLKDYLDAQLTGESAGKVKNPQAAKFSWRQIMGESNRIKASRT